MRLTACLISLNEDRWIDICIESMLPYVDEIICIDGGSTDNTINILKKYSKVKYYIIRQSTGQRYKEGYDEGERRNIINNVARGEWIIHMDCDELFEDAVWDHLDEWLNVDEVVGYGFHRINYYYNFDYHKPIDQPNDGGEIRLYRNLPEVSWEPVMEHSYLRYKGRRLRSYGSPIVKKTNHLVQHLHRVGMRGYPPEHDRRNTKSHIITKAFVDDPTKGFKKTVDNNYVRPIKLPSILYEKDVIRR